MSELKPCPFCGSGNVFEQGDNEHRGWWCYCYDCGAEGPIRSDHLAAWNQRAEPAPRWIPVEERLPENPGWYWVWINEERAKRAHYSGGERSEWIYNCREIQPTHWMPLPDAPKEGE